MPETNHLQDLSEALNLSTELREIEISEHFFQKQQKFEGLSEACCNYIDFNLPVNLPDTILVELLDEVGKSYDKGFTDTFCFHLITWIFSKGNVPIFKKLAAYVFENELKQSKRKLYNIFPDLNFPESEYIDFRKVIFINIQKENPVKALKLILEYYKPDGTFGENIWDSLEIEQAIDIAVAHAGASDIYKMISDKILRLYLLAQFEDPSFMTGQLELFILDFENKNGPHNINTIRSNRKSPLAKSTFNDLGKVQQGKEYIVTGAFSEYFDFFQQNEAGYDELNAQYNRANREINHIISDKLGISDFHIGEDFFNIKQTEELVVDFTYRLCTEKIKQNIIEELGRSFDAATSIHITSTCLDYLTITYYTIITLIKQNAIPALTDQDKSNCVALYEGYQETHKESGMVSEPTEIEDFEVSDLSTLAEQYGQIDQLTVQQRLYDLSSFKVKEEINVIYKNGESVSFEYIGNIPFRYYNLLAIDHRVFDRIDFSFLKRALDFLNGRLSDNITDLILRNQIDSFGLLSTLIFEAKSDDLLQKILFIHNATSCFELQLSPGNIQRGSNFFEHLSDRVTLSEELKQDLLLAFGPYRYSHNLFTGDTPGKTDLLNNAYNQCSKIVCDSIVESVYNNNAAIQANRLNEKATPNDLAFWVSKEERKAISDQNDYRGNMINNYNHNCSLANKRVEDLINFLPVTAGITTALLPCFTLCDYNKNTILSIVQLNSSMEPHPWYVKNVVGVDTELLKKVYLLENNYVDFFDKYSVDLSDLSKNGLKYLLELGNFLEDGQAFENKFLNHCLDFNEAIYLGRLNGRETADTFTKKRSIQNDQFAKSTNLAKYFLSKEKTFLGKLFGAKLQLDHHSLIELRQYNKTIGDQIVAAQRDVMHKFNAAFEPMLKKWNDDFYISFSIGFGQNFYWTFTFSNADYRIWVPMAEIKNYRFPAYSDLND